MKIAASEAIFIDDNPKNVDAAISVGLDGIVFRGADNLRTELRKRGINI